MGETKKECSDIRVLQRPICVISFPHIVVTRYGSIECVYVPRVVFPETCKHIMQMDARMIYILAMSREQTTKSTQMATDSSVPSRLSWKSHSHHHPLPRQQQQRQRRRRSWWSWTQTWLPPLTTHETGRIPRTTVRAMRIPRGWFPSRLQKSDGHGEDGDGDGEEEAET